MWKKIIVALLHRYRRDISPRKRRPCCRFYPTCSGYALTAVEEWGVTVGLAMSAGRILRCHPFGGDGVDPVPINTRKRRASRDTSLQQRRGEELLALCYASPKDRKETWIFN